MISFGAACVRQAGSATACWDRGSRDRRRPGSIAVYASSVASSRATSGITSGLSLGLSADGAAVSIEAKQSDITRLQPGDLAGATLITASALLDMLTEDELCGLVTGSAAADCPILVAMSVVPLFCAKWIKQREADEELGDTFTFRWDGLGQLRTVGEVAAHLAAGAGSPPVHSGP